MVSQVAGTAGHCFTSLFVQPPYPSLYAEWFLSPSTQIKGSKKHLAELPKINVLNPLSTMLISPWIALSYWINPTLLLFKQGPF